MVGQDQVVKTIKALAQRGFGGRAFWISGPSGTGKTTIARLIAAEVADLFFVQELDATDFTPAAMRDAEPAMHLWAWGKGGRAYMHGLRRDTIRRLLVLLERLPEAPTWIRRHPRALGPFPVPAEAR